MNRVQLTSLIRQALDEDLGTGDLTTELIFDRGHLATGIFKAKADGVLAGMQIIELCYRELGDEVTVELIREDGDQVIAGDHLARVKGPVRNLLTAERVILNLLQHASGIATQTREVVEALNDPDIMVTDTRKTLPGLRQLQKYAVRCGGGRNHRYRLDDAVMIKDNHINAAGSIQAAVKMVRGQIGHTIKVEVETEDSEQVLEAVKAEADIIMLDNQSPESVKSLSKLIPEHIVIEVSGGITPANIHSYQKCGANVISLGWLTHSVKALDISFALMD